VLDDVERRRLLVEPAGESPAPFLVAALDVELDECAGQLLLLPRRGALARAQPDDHVADADRLAGLELQVARGAVALVEQADHRLALRHRRGRRRRDARFGHFLDFDHRRRRFRRRIGLGVCDVGRDRRAILILKRDGALPGGDAQPGEQSHETDSAQDHASGVHAS